MGIDSKKHICPTCHEGFDSRYKLYQHMVKAGH